ncbi:VWA domain-containing protein [bacterium]|nr:VWA domain-containing protein [bacterium]
MGFIHPEMFWALAAIVPILIAWSFAKRWRQRRLGQFVVPENWSDLAATVSSRARFHKGALVILALVLSVVAAARPWYGTREKELRQRGVNLIVAVDISLSMAARDVGSMNVNGKTEMATRLTYASSLVRQILVEVPGHRVGVMPFAGEAFLQCPLTSDYGVVMDVVNDLGFDLLDAPGSDFRDLVKKAGEAFKRSGDGRRVLLIVSDGEDHSEKIREAIAAAKEYDMQIYALGVGSRDGAPLVRPDGTYVEDEQGIKVISKLGDGVLRELANGTGGKAYVAPVGSRLDPGPVINDLNTIARDDLGKDKRVVRQERYQWPLALALLCLALEAVIGERRRQPARKVS